MTPDRYKFLTGLLIFILAACQAGTPQATATRPQILPIATNTSTAPTITLAAAAPSVTVLPSTTPPTLTPTPPAQTSGATPLPLTKTSTPPAPTAPATAQPTAPVEPLPPTLDDRSTPTGLILSYFNAINRKEYLRAYAYYRTPSQTVGAFDAFVAGYQNTASVIVTLGTIGGDNGAGQMNYTVTALLKSISTSAVTTTYAACYILHLSQPGVQATPPFAPMAIRLGKATQVANNADPASALANACSGPDFPQSQPINPAPQTNTQDISSANYLDERSSALNVVKSLLNAINRKEFARAYAYWQNPATAPGPFAAYQQGFSTTARVDAIFGAVQSDAGAGQLYYKVPLAEKVTSNNGAVQTFMGCYTLHIAQPALQFLPPFIPLGITKGDLNLVTNAADIQALQSNSAAAQALLNTACGQP